MTEGPEVYRAIANVMGKLAAEGISKSRQGTGISYKFRGIDDVYNSLARLLSDEKLVIIPRVLSRELLERETHSKSRMAYCFVDMEFDIVSAVDGSKHTARTQGEAMDTSDKSTNKAMSAAYKYMAFQVFCIPTEGDHDTENADPLIASAAGVNPNNTATSAEAEDRKQPTTQVAPSRLSKGEQERNAGLWFKRNLKGTSEQFKQIKAIAGEDWGAIFIEAENEQVSTPEELLIYVTPKNEGKLPE